VHLNILIFAIIVVAS